jgi:hypothetical protein
MEQMDKKDLGFILTLTQASHNETTSIMQTLLDSYEKQIAEQRAELAIIRQRIGFLVDQPWVPNPTQIWNALFVYKEDIEQYIRENAEDS